MSLQLVLTLPQVKLFLEYFDINKSNIVVAGAPGLHPATHKIIHDKQAINWAKKSKGNSTEKRGKPPKKTEPTSQELLILKCRKIGMSRKEVADLLGLKDHQVKRAIRECSKFGYELNLKPGPKKGCEQKGGNIRGVNQYSA